MYATFMDYKFVLSFWAEKSLKEWPKKHQDKITDFLRILAEQCGVLDEPYSKHIRGKIRELRVDFGKTRYRLLYSLLPDRIIIILMAFSKNTDKTPENIIKKAEIILDSYQKYYEKN